MIKQGGPNASKRSEVYKFVIIYRARICEFVARGSLRAVESQSANIYFDNVRSYLATKPNRARPLTIGHSHVYSLRKFIHADMFIHRLWTIVFWTNF